VSLDPVKIKATADRMIASAGRQAELVSFDTSGPDFDPVVTETTKSITLYDMKYSLTNRNNSLVQSGDKLFLVQADATPALEDKIRVDGVDYAMVDIQPTFLNASIMLYEVQARA